MSKSHSVILFLQTADSFRNRAAWIGDINYDIKYDIKVSQECFRSIRSCLLSNCSRSTLMSYCLPLSYAYHRPKSQNPIIIPGGKFVFWVLTSQQLHHCIALVTCAKLLNYIVSYRPIYLYMPIYTKTHRWFFCSDILNFRGILTA